MQYADWYSKPHGFQNSQAVSPRAFPYSICYCCQMGRDTLVYMDLLLQTKRNLLPSCTVMKWWDWSPRLARSSLSNAIYHTPGNLVKTNCMQPFLRFYFYFILIWAQIKFLKGDVLHYLVSDDSCSSLLIRTAASGNLTKKLVLSGCLAWFYRCKRL